MTAKITVTLDLAKLIELTVDQVRGSDERMMLRDFLARNMGEAQHVTFRRGALAIIEGPERK
jgi:hypothetical protein